MTDMVICICTTCISLFLDGVLVQFCLAMLFFVYGAVFVHRMAYCKRNATQSMLLMHFHTLCLTYMFVSARVQRRCQQVCLKFGAHFANWRGGNARMSRQPNLRHCKRRQPREDVFKLFWRRISVLRRIFVFSSVAKTIF